MRRPLIRLGPLWDRIWFREFDPLSVSVFRISLGGMMFLTLLALWPSWAFFYSAEGIAKLRPGQTPGLQQMASLFYLTDGIVPTQVLAVLGLLAALGFLVGYQTRACTIFLFVLESSMIHRCPSSINGEDLVYRMVLFYSCFAPLNRTLAVDSWLSQRRGVVRPAPQIWPIRMMQLNVALLYVFTQMRKLLGDPAWLAGDALYYTLVNTTWSRWPWPLLFANPLLGKAATYGALFIETAFPVVVWFRPVRRYAVAALMGVHLSIALMLQNVTFFSLAMVATLWIFMPAEDTRRLGRFLAGLLHRDSPRPG